MGLDPMCQIKQCYVLASDLVRLQKQQKALILITECCLIQENMQESLKNKTSIRLLVT